jgi:parallel beta-helix repeat protein
VLGLTAEAFVQDIDTSNVVDGKTIYYFVNSDNLTINPAECPNMGFLAIVNCTNAAISDIDLSLNKDGLLIAESTKCSLTNITLIGNLGPLLYGGMTFFESNNNSVVDNRVSNNNVGVCLYNSTGNIFYHNLFANNSRQVVSNFYDPFSPSSGSYSINSWNNGFEGNYWSDYDGTDANHDGIGDTPYVIDANNVDHYPLMGHFESFNVSTWSHPNDGFEEVDVISNFTISNLGLYEWLTTPNQYLQPEQLFLILIPAQGQNMTAGFCRMTLPNNILNASHYIVLIDMTPIIVNKLAISNDTHTTLYFTFNTSAHEGIITLPEFPSLLILPLFFIATLLAVIVYRKKHAKISGSPQKFFIVVQELLDDDT